MVSMMPNVKVGHIGLFRDPDTLEPVKYYFKMPPDIKERDIIVVDPMLATGGSASAAISFLKETGAKHIKLMCIIGAPEGVERMQKDRTPTWTSLWPPWTSGSTTTATSSPVWATPATVSSAPSKPPS